MNIRIITDPQKWKETVERFSVDTIYASYEWVTAGAMLESGQAMLAELGSSVVPFIKRQIPDTITYYDLTTAFDFGLDWYHSYHRGQFWEWCASSDIVSGFVRCHPWEGVSGNCQVRDNVVVNLTKPLHMLWNEIASGQRTPIRQGWTQGVTVARCPIGDFAQLFWQNVEELQRPDYFMFPEKYFAAIAHMVDCYGAYSDKGKLLAAHLYVRDGKRLFYFLAARDLKEKAPATDVLIWETIQRAQDEGYEVFHLGGGGTESLMRYKQKWSPDRISYYTSKHVYMPETYFELSKWKETDFFPSYRG